MIGENPTLRLVRWCLNPYCNGCCIVIEDFQGQEWWRLVLILIVMDVVL